MPAPPLPGRSVNRSEVCGDHCLVSEDSPSSPVTGSSVGWGCKRDSPSEEKPCKRTTPSQLSHITSDVEEHPLSSATEATAECAQWALQFTQAQLQAVGEQLAKAFATEIEELMRENERLRAELWGRSAPSSESAHALQSRRESRVNKVDSFGRSSLTERRDWTHRPSGHRESRTTNLDSLSPRSPPMLSERREWTQTPSGRRESRKTNFESLSPRSLPMLSERWVAHHTPSGRRESRMSHVESVGPRMSAFSKASMRKSQSFRDGLFSISKKFDELDVEGSRVLKIDRVKDALVPMASTNEADLLRNLPSLMDAYRQARPELFEGLGDDEMSFAIFKKIMVGEDLEFLNSACIDTVQALRSICVKSTTLARVSDAAAVDISALTEKPSTKEDWLWWLEPMVGLAIVFNAAAIGLSQDLVPESGWWKAAEIGFTVFFVTELLLRLCERGLWEHFCGADWKWNLFDTLLVIFAVVDMAVWAYVVLGNSAGDVGALSDVTVLRTMRLLRVARLVRLFRFKHLRELTLMANGIIGGLRTLFWAFVLLFGLVYALGIFCRQVMAEWRRNHQCEHDPRSCTEHELVLCEHYQNMFGDLFKTCFTVFRCITGDCNFPSGMPIAPTLLETHGTLFTMGYVCSFLFVIFGVFNLIMSVFVESTMESARQAQQKKRLHRYQQHHELVEKLQNFVEKITSSETRTTRSWLSRLMLKFSATSWFFRRFRPSPAKMPMSFKVTRDVFDMAMADPETEEMLDDLDISLPSRQKLFDILDSNNNGKLDINEIVDGIMRLRGAADQADIISTSLMIRSLQKDFADMQLAIEKVHQKVEWNLIRDSMCMDSIDHHRLSQ